MRDKVSSQDMLPGLAMRAPVIWLQLRRNVHSGLPLTDLVQLAAYARDVPPENIHQGVIDFHDVTSAVVNGADVLMPNPDAIRSLMATVFGADYNKQ